MEYVRLKKVFHILDIVITDDSIKHKGKAIRKRLKELETEDVEKVVRCKDCMHWIYYADEKRCICDLHCTHTNRDDFCSFGI